VKFTYYIYPTNSEEDIATTLETSEPLPHLEVGHELLLTSENYSQKIGSALVVERIRVVASHLGGEFLRYDIHVFCRGRE
jgi:hypothetical protein